MMKSIASIIAIFGVTACAAGTVLPGVIQHKLRHGGEVNAAVFGAFEEFMSSHAKSYTSEEEKLHRFNIFKENLAFIKTHNADTTKSFTLGVNEFTDLSDAEFEQKYLGYKRPVSMKSNKVADWLNHVTADDLPKEVNWVKKGCVTPVKNQGTCGSCWAFSATGSLEGQNCVDTGKLVSFSEQQLVDCAQPEGANGCNGGIMDIAFQYVIDNNGLCSEGDYPYEGDEEQCKAKKCKEQVQLNEFQDVPKMNATALQAAVAKTGPVSIAIHAGSKEFRFYKKGVFKAKCAHQLNHGVLAAGYGVEDGSDYWLVKNSWGEKWGDEGYIKMLRDGGDQQGECGLLEFPSFPIIKKQNA